MMSLLKKRNLMTFSLAQLQNLKRKKRKKLLNPKLRNQQVYLIPRDPKILESL